MAQTDPLSRRERQIMDIVYARGEATATHVLEDMADPPSRASVRTFLRILEQKGHLTHAKRGREFMYRPTRPRKTAGRSAMRRVLQTFFGGSLERGVAAYLSDADVEPTSEELDRLRKLIDRAKREEE